jgi:gas vesicle protein
MNVSVETNMIHKFKRYSQRLAIKIVKSFTPSHQMSEYEREGINICRKLVAKRESTLLISPISGKRYIKSEDGQIFIVIEDLQITIVNHQYSYNIRISDKTYQKIRGFFDTEVERRREDMETEIRSNVKHSLYTIYKNLTNE